MVTKRFKKINTTDYNLQTIQSNVANSLDSLQLNPILNGITLDPVDVTSGDNVINHLLDRKLQGWVVIGNTAAIDLYDKQSTNDLADRTLILNASGTATIKLYVF